MDLDTLIGSTRPAKAEPSQEKGVDRLDALIAAVPHPSGAAKAGLAKPAPSPSDSFLRQHLQGATSGLGDRLAGETEASVAEAADMLRGNAAQPWAGLPREALAFAASQVPLVGGVLARHARGDQYARIANEATNEQTALREAGNKANPWAAGAANVTGPVLNPGNLLALGPVSKLGGIAKGAAERYLPQAVAKYLAGRIGGAVTAGGLTALSAGAQGLNETGDVREAGGRAASALPIGLAAGAAPMAVGAGLMGAGVARKNPSEILSGLALLVGGGAHKAAGAPEALKATGISQARRVLTGGADSLANKAPLADAVVEEALRSKAIAPFGTTKGAAERLGALREQVGEQYGAVIKALEARGVRGPDASRIADAWLQRAVEESTTSLSNQSVPNLFMDQAQAIMSKGGETGRMGLTQAIEMTRKLDKEAKYGKYEETPLNEAKLEQAGDVRQAVEDAVDKQAHLAPELAAEFAPVKGRMSRLIEAHKAAAKGAGQASRRNTFSLRDTALAAAELAHSGPIKAAEMAIGSNILRSRLPSTVARGAYGLGRGLEFLRIPELRPLSSGLYAPSVAKLLERPLSLLPQPTMADDQQRQLQRAYAANEGL